MSLSHGAGKRREHARQVEGCLSRVHARLGARIATPSPRSMRINGSVADWEQWTGMAFPVTGEYVVPRAAATVTIVRESDRGTYFDPNLWMVHSLDR